MGQAAGEKLMILGRLTIVAAGWLAAALPAMSSGAERPNVVMIVADDLGWGDLRCQGADDMQTPHLDQLFAESRSFRNFYANCCVCSPTRAAILTGHYPDRVGVPGVIRTHADNSWGYFDPDADTLAATLQSSGYQTLAIGKWHLGLRQENHPMSRGFSRFRGFLGDMMDDYYDHRRHGNNYMRNQREEIDPQGHATDLFSDWAAEAIKSAGEAEDAFFLYLAYNAPHTPIQPPEPWVDKVLERESGIDPRRARLVALIEHMDAGIGRVLAAVDELGSRDETVLIITSDNGGQLSVGAKNGPWRGGKGEMYEGGLRVPMCVRWPASITPAETTAVASTVDLMPTVLEICGAAAGGPTDGMSLVPVLQDAQAVWPERTVYYVRREGGTEFNGLTIQALRRGSWKILQNRPGEPFELYNLAEDPNESQNRRSMAAGVYRDMSAALRQQIQAGGQVPWQKAER